jgi:hypothetical protein
LKADIQTDVADRVAVIQAPTTELRIMRYELSDYEWSVIRPMLPQNYPVYDFKIEARAHVSY